MRKFFWGVGIICAGVFLGSKRVTAYIDPGTGGIIVGSLWPLAAAFLASIAAFLVKYFWNPIKRALAKLMGGKGKGGGDEKK